MQRTREVGAGIAALDKAWTWDADAQNAKNQVSSRGARRGPRCARGSLPSAPRRSATAHPGGVPPTRAAHPTALRRPYPCRCRRRQSSCSCCVQGGRGKWAVRATLFFARRRVQGPANSLMKRAREEEAPSAASKQPRVDDAAAAGWGSALDKYKTKAGTCWGPSGGPRTRGERARARAHAVCPAGPD